MVLLSNVDLRPSDSTSDIWGYNNGTTFLAIQGSLNGTLFVDVTDPYSPVEVGYIDGPYSDWRDIKTYQHYAYIVTEGAGPLAGMQIVDLSDPFNPTLVNTYSTNFTTTHNIWIDADRGHAWLVGTDNGTRILDLADPENPVEIGSWVIRYVHDIYVKNEIAYFAEIANGIHEIVDATNPASLQILSTWATPTGATHNSWPNSDFTLLVTTDEDSPGGHVTVYDITDKTSTPPKLAEYEPDPSAVVHNVFFDDVPGADRAVMSHYGLGVRYIDLQRPSVPVEMGAYDTRPSGDSGYAGCWGVYPYDPRGYIYATDIQSGLFVLELLTTGGPFTGKVRDASTGAGIAGATVLPLGGSALITANAQGEFGYYADPGEMVARFSAPGYQSNIVAAGEILLGTGVDIEVDLLPLPTTAVTGTVVRAADQAPVQGAVVTVIETGQNASTDAAGSFTIGNVAIGQRLVSVDRMGYSGDQATVLLKDGVVEVVDFQLLEPALVDNLEINSGWTLDPASTASTGNWVRQDPIGTAAGSIQPENDHTPAPGIYAFFTGQGPNDERADPEMADVDGGTTALLSPILDLSALGNPTLTYHRWFSTNVGLMDGGTMRVELSDDGGSSWTTVELLNTDANSWTPVSFALADYVTLNDQFQARFACEAIPEMDQQRLLECAIDDIEITQECRARVVPGGIDSDYDGWLDPCDPCPFDPVDDIDGDGLCADADNCAVRRQPGPGRRRRRRHRRRRRQLLRDGQPGPDRPRPGRPGRRLRSRPRRRRYRERARQRQRQRHGPRRHRHLP